MKKIPPNNLIPKTIIADKELQRLAKIYGTPLFIYDRKILVRYWKILKNFLPDYFSIYYSVKSNPNPAVINTFRQLGANFETVSIGEIKAVKESGEENDKVIMIGPGKRDLDLEYAIDNKVYLSIESISELHRVQKICKKRKCQIKVALRVNPGEGNGIISMGGKTQFGMEESLVKSLIKETSEYPNIIINGLQYYLGTGILKCQDFLRNTQVILDSIKRILNTGTMCLEFIDIGGGIGIPYHQGESDFEFDVVHDKFIRLMDDFRKENGYYGEMAFEAGRFLSGASGIFLARVVDVKTNFDKKFIILDGGTNVLALESRYMGFRHLPMKTLGSDGMEKTVTICGPLCTSSDCLAYDIQINEPLIGDVVAIYLTGAYAFSASPGLFLSHGYPKEVLYDGGSHKEVLNYAFRGERKYE